MRVYAERYIELGQRLADARVHFALAESADEEKLVEYNKMLSADLAALLEHCEAPSLATSMATIRPRIKKLPDSEGEFDLLLDVVHAELQSKLFLFVPTHLAQYYEWAEIVGDNVLLAFPNAAEELRSAGTAHAAGLNTAAVFHAMRAAEMALRALGAAMEVDLRQPIELADQQAILRAVQEKISEIGRRPRSAERDADLEFFAQAAAQLQFFKDGWRVRVAHGRASYNESQAREVIDHVRAFFEIAAARLKE